MIALVAVGGVITILWGERIGVHQGQGWDGEAYSSWARDFPGEILHKGVTVFQSNRVLPSAVIYYVLGALGVARSIPNVILAFQILNLLTLLGSVVLLVRIAVILEWSRAATWAAFVATFLGFANAREALYYPTMTDCTAFLLALAAVWAFVGRRPIVQWAVAFAGSFTWPALAVFSYLAVILPRASAPLPITTGRWHRPLAAAVAVGAALFIVAWFLFVLTHVGPLDKKWIDLAHHDLYPLTIGLIVLSTATAAYVVARADQTWSIAPYLRQVGWRRIALGVAAVAVIVVVGQRWSALVGTRGTGYTWREVRGYYVSNAVRGPLWNVVHQVVYFGPIVLVAIGRWRRVAIAVMPWGATAILTLGSLVVTAVNADARHLLHLLPFVVVATISATAELWTPRRVVGFAALYFVWSKIWFVFDYNEVHDSLKWPDQRHFMHHGPWASDGTFLAHLAAAVLTAIALWFLLRRRSPEASG